MYRLRVLLGLALLAGALPARAAPHEVELTWMSIANWYFKFDDLRIVMDGYITRVPQKVFVASEKFPADQFAFTNAPWPVDVPAVLRVQDALAAGGRLDYVLAGHSHFDHTYDTATWAAVTGAPIIGGLSTCYQAMGQGLPASQCRVVSGSWKPGQPRDRLLLGNGVTMRVVRFNHSGNASNPIQHFARELSGPPDFRNHGFRAGVGEDFPNGGGGRAFLFTVDNPGGPISFFVNNSASAFDLDGDIIVGGVNYGSPLFNLRGAMEDAGLKSVDVWIGTGGFAIANLVVPVIHPKVYIPNHWDGLFNAFDPGMPFPFRDAVLQGFLEKNGVKLMPQGQYFDTYRLDANGVTMKPNHSVKQKLGFSDVQQFAPATAAIAASVRATVSPEDCDQ